MGDEPFRAGLSAGESARLWTENGEAVGRVCMALLGDGAAANEATEEAFAEAVGSSTVTRGQLFAAARRACAKRLERGTGRTRDWADTKRDPVTDAERMRVALGELKPTEREAVVLHLVGKLAPNELAEACGVDEEAARERVGRGLLRLRAYLGDTK
jgi:RNA polymerase sigma-70 factor, ECF subfamily